MAGEQKAQPGRPVNFQLSERKNLLYGIIHMMQDTIQIKLARIVNISPFIKPPTVKMIPEKQKPTRAKSSSFRSFTDLVEFRRVLLNDDLLCLFDISSFCSFRLWSAVYRQSSCQLDQLQNPVPAMTCNDMQTKYIALK